MSVPEHNVAHPKFGDQCEGTIDGPLPAKIPEGTYVVQLEHWDGVNIFGRPQLVLTFRVIGGDYEGEQLPRWYNVREHEGHRIRNTKFTVGPTQNLVTEFVEVFDKPRLDRLTLNRYRRTEVLAKVETKNGRSVITKLMPTIEEVRIEE